MVINIDEEVYFKSEAGHRWYLLRMRQTLFLAMRNQKKLMSLSPSIVISRLSITLCSTHAYVGGVTDLRT